MRRPASDAGYREVPNSSTGSKPKKEAESRQSAAGGKAGPRDGIPADMKSCANLFAEAPGALGDGPALRGRARRHTAEPRAEVPQEPAGAHAISTPPIVARRSHTRRMISIT